MTSESFASSPPLSSLAMAFRDCGGAAFKMQRPLAPRRQLRPPKRLPPAPLLHSSSRRRWCREGGGTGTASEVGRGGGTRAADDRACKNYQEFFIASFPPLFIASLCAPHGGSKLKALACASNTCSVIRFPPSHHFFLYHLLAVAPASKPKLPRLLKRFE